MSSELSTYTVWDKQTMFRHPDGVVYSFEENAKMFPFIRSDATVVLEMSNGQVFGVHNLLTLLNNYGISADLDIDMQLEQIKQARIRESNPDYDEIEELLDTIEGGFMQ